MSDWYQELTNDKQIQQGDLIQRCPVIEAPANLEPSETYRVQASFYNVIVMTQSCDFAQNHAEYVTVCPYVPFEKYFEGKVKPEIRDDPQKFLAAKNVRIKELAAGKYLGVHILNVETKNGVPEHIVVSLRQPYVIKHTLLKQLISNQGEKRVRLLSPYLEHLAQAFATLYMRVGLPASVDLLR